MRWLELFGSSVRYFKTFYAYLAFITIKYESKNLRHFWFCIRGNVLHARVNINFWVNHITHTYQCRRRGEVSLQLCFVLNMRDDPDINVYNEVSIRSRARWIWAFILATYWSDPLSGPFKHDLPKYLNWLLNKWTLFWWCFPSRCILHGTTDANVLRLHKFCKIYSVWGMDCTFLRVSNTN